MVNGFHCDIYSQCRGKESFETGAQAAKAKRRIAKSSKRLGCLNPYRCVHCGKYHLGNPVKGSTKAKRRDKDRFFRAHGWGDSPK